MKPKTVRYLSFAVKFLTVLTSLATYANMLPDKYLAASLVVFQLASTTKDYLLQVGDRLDDGSENQSFRG